MFSIFGVFATNRYLVHSKSATNFRVPQIILVLFAPFYFLVLILKSINYLGLKKDKIDFIPEN